MTSFWNNDNGAANGTMAIHHQKHHLDLAVGIHKRQHHQLHAHLALPPLRITTRMHQRDLAVAIQHREHHLHNTVDIQHQQQHHLVHAYGLIVEPSCTTSCWDHDTNGSTGLAVDIQWQQHFIVHTFGIITLGISVDCVWTSYFLPTSLLVNRIGVVSGSAFRIWWYPHFALVPWCS